MEAVVEKFVAKAKSRPRQLVLPESEDPRIIEAAKELVSRQIAQPILISTESPPADGVLCVDPNSDQTVIERYAARYRTMRPRTAEKVARRLITKPLFFAGMMVQEGQADALIAGAANPTARVIEAGLLTIGLADGIDTPSSFFLMVMPEGHTTQTLVFADCAINIEPDAAALADIAIASADSAAKLLDVEPKVALLSFSTHGSAKHARVEKVIQALELIQQRRPELVVDGELQVDSALSAAVANKKIKRTSGVAGHANVLIFPDLDAGNIGYKLTQYLASATAIGPILQGFARPVCDLSRGASVADIVASCAVTLALD